MKIGMLQVSEKEISLRKGLVVLRNSTPLRGKTAYGAFVAQCGFS